MSRPPTWMGRLLTTVLITPLKSFLRSFKILLGLLLTPIRPLAAPLMDLAKKPKNTPDILTEADESRSKMSQQQQVALPESVNFHFTRCTFTFTRCTFTS